MEGKFCELRLYGVLRSSAEPRPRKVTYETPQQNTYANSLRKVLGCSHGTPGSCTHRRRGNLGGLGMSRLVGRRPRWGFERCWGRCQLLGGVAGFAAPRAGRCGDAGGPRRRQGSLRTCRRAPRPRAVRAPRRRLGGGRFQLAIGLFSGLFIFAAANRLLPQASGLGYLLSSSLTVGGAVAMFLVSRLA